MSKNKLYLLIAVLLAGLILFGLLLAPDNKSGFNKHILVLERPHGKIISDSVFLRVHKTKLFIDSLRIHDTLKLKAILLARPGLLDNIQLLENIYKLQNK